MAKRDDGEGLSRFLPGRGRAPILITLLFVGVVGGVYFAYFRKQSDYFAGRDLRLLSMLTAQIAGRADMYTGFVRAGEPPAGIPEMGTCPPSNDKKPFQRELVGTPQGWSMALQDQR